MKIVAHCLVKNEENFIWFAINSIIDHVDEIMVWDQGSSDRTISIIESIKSPKIKFKKAGESVSRLRQKMLEETKADWVIILDGDEIWHEESIANLIKNIKTTKCDIIVSPNYLLIGDMFHYLPEDAGRYRIAGRVGHYNIRAIKNTSGLHVEGAYPDEAYINNQGVKVQNLPNEKILFLDDKYIHTSFLPRSSKDSKKLKYEIGVSLPRDFFYPEVFFKKRPEHVPTPWQPMGLGYKILSSILTPVKKLKRKFV